MKRLRQLQGVVWKEILSLLRDYEALLILIGMPAVFVLIMSLALQDTFAHRAPQPLKMAVQVQQPTRSTHALLAILGHSDSLHLVPWHRATGHPTVAAAVLRGHLALGLTLISRTAVAPGAPRAVTAQLYVNPTLPAPLRALGISLVQRAVAEVGAGQVRDVVQRLLPPLAAGALHAPVQLQVMDRGAPGAPTPTSVQQNAPAWALLAMFFLVIPLSVSLIRERQQGVLLRLRALPVAPWVLLVGKLVPYFLVNALQLGVVLLEGRWLLPLFGGDALQIGHAPAALLLVASAANLAALGYGLLVASLVRTQEQATSFGAVSVLIMAAMGGILVPKLVMPLAMQKLAAFSPMSWGLDGFQQIFVLGAGVHGVWPESLRLLGFAALCLAVAGLRFQRELGPQ
ncbi:MAG TPA: ABC transporter permease [Acidiferrobacteraceae bacterium]|nr:ABC transporter permease [Acidiferrobacteraceae bacterium]